MFVIFFSTFFNHICPKYSNTPSSLSHMSYKKKKKVQLTTYGCGKNLMNKLANSADPDQTPRSEASDPGLHSLLWPSVCPNHYSNYNSYYVTCITHTFTYLFSFCLFIILFIYLFFSGSRVDWRWGGVCVCVCVCGGGGGGG